MGGLGVCCGGKKTCPYVYFSWGEGRTHHTTRGNGVSKLIEKGTGQEKQKQTHIHSHTNPKPAPQARAHILTHAREIKTKLQNETKNKSISKLSERVGNWMAMTRVQ